MFNCTDDDRPGCSSPAGGSSSIFIPDVKSRTLGSDSLLDMSEHDQNWDFKGKKAGGATAGWSSGMNQRDSPGASSSSQKTLPEQLKVFKGDDLSGYKPTSPKNRRMLYSGSSRPSFPGSFFPLESSPRHQRRAVNISEPFAVSVPLRVSAVISSNSTPCRVHSKEKAATLKPSKEPSDQSSSIKKSNTFPLLEPKKQEGTEKKHTEALTSRVWSKDSGKEAIPKAQGEKKTCELEPLSSAHARESKDAAPPSGEETHNHPSDTKLDQKPSTEKDLHQELKIPEPETDRLDLTHKPVFTSVSTCGSTKLTMEVKQKRSRSSPSLSLLCREPAPNVSQIIATRSVSKKKQPSESDLLFCVHKNSEAISGTNAQNVRVAGILGAAEKLIRRQIPPFNKDDPAHIEQYQLSFKETNLDCVINPLTIKDLPQVASFSGSDSRDRTSQKHEFPKDDKEIPHDGAKKSLNPEMEASQRLSVCLEEKCKSVEPPEDEEGCGEQVEELDLVEPWEDLSSTKQWVTSPLHSPDIEELFNQLSPFSSKGETQSSEGGKLSSSSGDDDKRSLIGSTEQSSGNPPQSTSSETKWTHLSTAQLSLSSSSTTHPQTAKGSSTKQKTATSSQRFNRQMSFETERREKNCFPKTRPCSLNLDLSHRYIRDISNQQNCNSSEFSCQKASSGTVTKVQSDLDLFLNDRQAPLRRNSAPVSVSSVRTAFMIKKCQAKAVPVVPPKVQYSQIPQTKQEGDLGAVKEPDRGHPKTSVEPSSAAPPLMMADLKEELENKEPGPKHQKTPNIQKSAESVKTTSTPELPVITRRHTPSLEVFVDCPRPNRGALLQRPSFRNRQRPQSLILLSPPFPIMDYPPSGDDGKLLSSIRGLNDTSALNVLSKEIVENFRTPEGILLQNKMTIPKSGQRLETSTSCFYQPQRRSMIFDSRSHRQIE
uniref:Rho GTPase activating protein 31 n=1 Tax=Kryptolebias marmoratus TaxID=37003 RepID=A0A3Q3B4D1_KRYMA